MTTEKLNTKELFISLDYIFSELLATIEALSEPALNTVPFTDSWTAAQLATHVTRSNSSIAQALDMEAKKAERNPGERVPELKEIFLDFTIKFQSPDFIIPAAGKYAKVFLTGRTQTTMDLVAKFITGTGGIAETAIVDALDEKAVNNFIDSLVKKAGSIDISFNAIGLKDIQGISLIDMALEDFIRPIRISMTTQFITAKAAGRYMIQQGSGVILSITATPAGKAYPLVGGFGPACSAIEAFSRNLPS